MFYIYIYLAHSITSPKDKISNSKFNSKSEIMFIYDLSKHKPICPISERICRVNITVFSLCIYLILSTFYKYFKNSSILSL